MEETGKGKTEMKIVVTIPCAESYKSDFLEAAGSCAELVFADPAQAHGAVFADADAIIGNPSVKELQGAGQLKWLQLANAGVERYVQNPDFPAHVQLTNATGAFGAVISEYIIAGILAIYRRLFDYKEQQKKELWKDAGSELQLMGKHVLILGAGDIGEQTARRLKAFDTRVAGIRRVVRGKPPVFDEMATLEELDRLLPEADIVVGCLPETPETIHILDERRLRLMKQSSLLVNVGRGSLVVTEALVRVLQDGHLLGAVLDVTEEEPLPKGHPLWGMNQVLLTPHISGRSFGHSEQVERRIVSICCKNLRRFLDGRPLHNRIDFTCGYADFKDRGAEE